MTSRIVKAVVLVKLDSGNVHEAIIEQGTLMNFLAGYTSVAGSLKVHEQPLDAVDLIEHESIRSKNNRSNAKPLTNN